MASLAGFGPHQTWKELLRLDNDPVRNQGVKAVLQRLTDGDGSLTSLALADNSAKVFGTLEVTGTLTLGGNLTGLGLTGTSLSVGPSGGSAVGGISATGAITGVSLNVGTGSITAGSVNVGTGTVTGAQFSGNAATVTNGVYQNSTYFIGTTSNALNRSSAAQTLSGVSIDGNAGTVSNLSVHAGTNNEANKIVRTDSNGYLQAGYIQSTAGNEGNASSPARVWGTNGSDSYLRSYQTEYLNVGVYGTWTPTPTSTTAGQTYTFPGQREGFYYKIGKVCFAFFRLDWRTGQAGNAGRLGISGLPFPPTNNGRGGVAVNYMVLNLVNSELPIPYITTSSTLDYYTNTGANYRMVDSGVSATITKSVYGVVIYPVA